MQKKFPSRSICFELVEENGKLLPAIVIEDHKLLDPLSYNIGETLKTAQWNIDRANSFFGFGRIEAREIIASVL